MLKKILHENKINFISIILFICPFLGGLHDLNWVFFITILILAGLIFKILKNKEVKLPSGFNLLLVVGYALSYFIVSFYAIDKGAAFLGFLKVSSILFIILLFLQYDFKEEEKQSLFYTIPYSGAFITIISILFWTVFFKEGRLQGLFNYANTFSLWLLMGTIVILFDNNKLKLKQNIILSVLLIGVMLANSRSISILLLLIYVLAIFINKSKRKDLLKTTGLIGILAIIIALIMSASGINNRLENVTVKSSEFVNRIIYFEDAARLILKNPFGYGFLGWWNIQGYEQTGVYDCVYVHNSALQVMLDVGVVPAILLMILLINSFFSKKVSLKEKLLLVIILGHSLIDFDMEFLILQYFIFLIIPYKTIRLNKYKLINSFLIMICLIYLYFFTVVQSNQFGNYKLAYTLYPNYTDAIISQMFITENSEKFELAKRANRLNKYSIDVINVLLEEALASNNIDKANAYYENILEADKYTMLNYINYTEFLSNVISYYNNQKDDINTLKYMEKIINIKNKIQKVLDNTNPLVMETEHKPRLEMPKEMLDFIEEIEVIYKRKTEG
jgi:hypothetical protein